jgi:hypothetical protein
MSNEDEINRLKRSVLRATDAENLAEQKMIAAEKSVIESTNFANKMSEEYDKRALTASASTLAKFGREVTRAEVAAVVARVEAKRVIEVDIKKANTDKRNADRDLLDAEGDRSQHGEI